MKKKLFLVLAIVAVMACIFAISVSADTIVPSTSNEYGTLTTFDEVIGRTDFSPNKADGTVARTVLFDGTSYYTVPTTYLLTKNPYEGDILLQFGFSAINSKLGKSFSKTSVIRCELPAAIKYLGGSDQNFNGFTNIIEIKLCDGLRFANNSEYKAFSNCKAIKTIDLSMMKIEHTKSTYSLFEYCDNLETVILPNAHLVDGKPVNYATDYTFNGCKKLEEIRNIENFFYGSTSINQKMFMDCWALPEIKIWDGVTTIGPRAFQSCSSITTIIFPDSVTAIGTTSETVFASCTSLKTVVLPKKVALSNYCFEKCTGLTDVWMPTEASTFANQAFGQIGSSRAINFYFQTATNTVTYTGTQNNNDPYVTAINAENDARLKFNTPLSTKCTVFLGGHTADIELSNDCAIICEKCKAATVNHSEDAEVLVTVVYLDYTQAGKKITACQSVGCTHSVEQELEALITCDGFSVEEKGTGIVVGYRLNQNAIAKYNELTGKTVKYGIYAATKTALNGGDIFDEEGMPIDGAVKAEVNEGFVALEIKICGITNLDTEFAMGAYLEISNESEKEYAFIEDEKPLEGEKYYFVSYNSVANK